MQWIVISCNVLFFQKVTLLVGQPMEFTDDLELMRLMKKTPVSIKKKSAKNVCQREVLITEFDNKL